MKPKYQICKSCPMIVCNGDCYESDCNRRNGVPAFIADELREQIEQLKVENAELKCWKDSPYYDDPPTTSLECIHEDNAIILSLIRDLDDTCERLRRASVYITAAREHQENIVAWVKHQCDMDLDEEIAHLAALVAAEKEIASGSV